MQALATRPAAEITTSATPEELAARWLCYADVSLRTADAYRRNISRYLSFLQARNLVSSRDAVIAYKKELQGTYKPATVAAYLAAVKAFYGWLAAEGISPNFADRVKLPKPAKGFKRDYLTADAVKAVHDATQSERDALIIATMTLCGLRTVEISRLNKEDLTTRVGRPVLYITGKGKDEKEAVNVPDSLYHRLKAYAAKKEGAALFTGEGNRSRGQRLTTRAISRIVKQTMQAAGYNSERLTAHSLRHTAITLAAKAGLAIEEVQAFARHTSINTTMIYNHAISAETNAGARAVAQAIGL